jgi:hypothetical protein
MDSRAASPWRAVAFAVLAVVVAAAVLLAWRSRRLETARRDAFSALTRDLRPGMPLDDVTGYLRQRGIAFTVEAGDDGPVVAGIGRESTSDGRVTQSSELQIEFDARNRLRAFRQVDVIRGR